MLFPPPQKKRSEDSDNVQALKLIDAKHVTVLKQNLRAATYKETIMYNFKAQDD